MGDAVGDEVDDLLRGVDHARLLHALRVVAEAVDHGAEALGNRGAGQGDAALDLAGIGDGHDAGHDRHLDPGLADPVHEAVHGRIVKKHLGREEITARIHLLFQMHDVLGLALALHVSLGIAGSADAEAVVDRLDIVDQLRGMVIVKHGAPLCRDVPAQGHDILDSVLAVVPDHAADHLLGRGHAGQVGQHVSSVLLLQIRRDPRRVLAGAAAGSVCHTHKIRPQGSDLLGRLLYRQYPGLRLGRKDLKRKGDFFCVENIYDLHIATMTSCLYISLPYVLLRADCIPILRTGTN